MEDKLKQAEELVEWLAVAARISYEEAAELKLKLTAKQQELNSIRSALGSMRDTVSYMKGEDPEDDFD